MDEKEIRAAFKRLRKAHEARKQPDMSDLLALAEGALLNLAKIAKRS